MRFKGTTPTQAASIAFADHILQAPEAHIAAEPPECLAELLEVATEHLTAILPHVGLGWKLIQLEILKGKTEARMDLALAELL